MSLKTVKLAFVALTVSFSTTAAYAQTAGRCDKAVTEAYLTYIEEQTENQFDMVNPISLKSAIEAVQESYEMSAEEKASALQKISDPANLLYNGVSNYMSGTGLELLIVDSQTCQITDKYFWYSE